MSDWEDMDWWTQTSLIQYSRGRDMEDVQMAGLKIC